VLRAAAIALLALAACSFDVSGVGGDDAIDAAGGTRPDADPSVPDASPNAPDANPIPIDANTTATCPADPLPPGQVTCPDVCDECTETGVCRILCGAGECNDTTLDCPANYACEVVCSGTDGCDSSRINCPDPYACSVSCDGSDACGNLDLRCGDGSCAIKCAASSCSGAQVRCGTGDCTAACTGSPAPTVDCGSACGCTGC
jgi:hypothetical protein